MKTAEEYIEQEYGIGHFESVAAMKDTDSLFALMQEYANYSCYEILNLAADKYKGIEMKDGFGCVCDVPGAIKSTCVHLP